MASAKGQRQAAMYGAEQLDAANDFIQDEASGVRARNAGWLTDATNAGLDTLYAGARNARARFTEALPEQARELDATYRQGRQDVADGYDGATARFEPWIKAGTDANTVLMGSLGLGGEGARTAAVDAFRTSPGYGFRVEQATDGVARKMSALGLSGSGNAMTAIADRAQDMADGEYEGWQTRLDGISGRGMTAAGAAATLGAQKGQTLANLAQTQGGRMSDLWGGYAKNLAGIDMAEGGAALDSYRGLATAGASSNLGTLSTMANSALGSAKAKSDLVFEAGKASDAARNANANLPLQIGGMVLGGIGQVAGLGTGGGSTLGGSLLSGLFKGS